MSLRVVQRPPLHEFSIGEGWLFRSEQVFDPRTIAGNDIQIADIAHSLARQARYLGHTPSIYSVAEHSIRVSRRMDDLIRKRTRRAATAEERMAGLLHDAAEAYIGDVPKYVKELPMMKSFRNLDKALTTRIMKRFNVEWGEGMRQLVGQADYDELAHVEWPEARGGVMGPEVAERAFLSEFMSLEREMRLSVRRRRVAGIAG